MKLDYAMIGRRIREARIAKKWTQAYLAEISGVEPSNISHIERAATKLSLSTIISIANALELTVDELIYGNLVKSSHISHAIINDLLSDCSPNELRAIAEIVKASKKAIRSIK